MSLSPGNPLADRGRGDNRGAHRSHRGSGRVARVGDQRHRDDGPLGRDTSRAGAIGFIESKVHSLAE